MEVETALLIKGIHSREPFHQQHGLGKVWFWVRAGKWFFIDSYGYSRNFAQYIELRNLAYNTKIAAHLYKM